MGRDSFVFYVSWLEGVKKFSPEIQREIKAVLLDYCAYGQVPEESEMSAEAYMAFTFAKPLIDANNKRYENGLKGGSKNGVSNNPNGRRGKQKPPMVENKTTNGSSEKLPMAEKNNYQKTTEELPNVNVNVNDNDNDNVNVKEKEKEKTKNKNFIPPTLEQVKAYIQERGYILTDAERFCDFYQSKGWMVGRNKMKDWKAAVRNWEREHKSHQKGSSQLPYKNDTEKYKNTKTW